MLCFLWQKRENLRVDPNTFVHASVCHGRCRSSLRTVRREDLATSPRPRIVEDDAGHVPSVDNRAEHCSTTRIEHRQQQPFPQRRKLSAARLQNETPPTPPPPPKKNNNTKRIQNREEGSEKRSETSPNILKPSLAAYKYFTGTFLKCFHCPRFAQTKTFSPRRSAGVATLRKLTY